MAHAARPSSLAPVLLFLAGTACHPGPPPRPMPADGPLAEDAPHALVGAAEARFLFPPMPPRDWRWPRDGPAEPDARFAWGITILTGDTAYLVGAAVRRRDHPADLHSLKAAISVARPSLAAIAPDSHVQVEVHAADVGVALEGARVVVTLRGGAVLARVFKARPARVRFGVLAPDEPRWWTDSTEVRYTMP